MARHVGGHGHVAAGCAHDQDSAAAQRPARVQHFERLTQGRQRFTASDAGLPAKSVEGDIGAGERAGVTARRARGRLGAAGLYQRDGFARSAARARRAREAIHVLDALDVEAEGRDTRIVG